MERQSDGELVARTLSGDGQAFACLVRKYQDYAYGTAVGVLADLELSQDVVQEAFLAAYLDLPKLRDAARFAGWLRGIVRHTAFRALRELNAVRALAEELGRNSQPHAKLPSPEKAAERSEARQLVRDALSRLSEPNREAVSLHYVDGLSYAEVAAFLDVSVTTVQGRLQRGRKKLKKELTMVADTFRDNPLSEDFSSEVRRLLEAVDKGVKQREASINRLAEIGPPAVDPLCEALGDSRIPVRRAAARALCEIGDERALRPILQVLYSGDYWIGNTLLRTGRALSVPGVREELINIARHGKRGDQYWAILALGHAEGDLEVSDRLDEIFHDTAQYSGTRQCALAALCELRPELATDLVIEALEDPKLKKSSGYAWWIALKDGLKLPVAICLSGLEREVAPNSRMMAGRLVLRLGDEGRSALLRAMRAGSRDRRAAAALAMSHEQHDEAFDVLVGELIDGYRERKWSRIVSRALAVRYGDRLLRWAEEHSEETARSPQITWAVAKVRISSGAGSAEEVFHYGAPSVRAAALRKLASEKGAEMLPELRRCLCEGQPGKVTQEAFRQMLRLRDAALPSALDMLKSDNWAERKAAYCLLRRWGKLTTKQSEAGRKDPHIAVRHAARWHPDWRKAAEWHNKWKKKLARDAD